MQKTLFLKYLFFVDILKVNDENRMIRIRPDPNKRHGSADPDPDPHQNVMDPQHCLVLSE
jgi:hypothetical protein